MKTSARFRNDVLVCTLILAGLAGNPVMAQDRAKETTVRALDAKAAKDLTANRVWQIRRSRTSGFDYWSWNSDGSVCVRLGENTGKCADTGRWKLDGQRICYDLTWWGETQELKSLCFRISEQSKGRFAWLSDRDITFHEFTVAK